MNSKGVPLVTADLMRNYIVVTDDAGSDADGEGAVFERSWLPLERLFTGAQVWMSGKSKDLISEYKMFGD